MILNSTLVVLKNISRRASSAQYFNIRRVLSRVTKIENGHDTLLEGDKEFQSVVDEYFLIGKPQTCIIIQPYVKWGHQKLVDITPAEQLEEAVALVKTLKNWAVEDTLSVPLDTLNKKTLFKSGNFEKIKNMVRNTPNISAVFINISMLKRSQMAILNKELRVLILDRYRVVMQILKTYATTKHAKLQVALAELHFMQATMSTENFFSTANPETLKLMIQAREQKLKDAIKQLRSQRELLRNKRREHNFPVVAVVGYTNAGKTSLIKALTGDSKLIPKDQLFATLDVTLHQGILPSGLQVLYVDTVGFISDIPTNLIECFVATLEDAILADVILHVEDLSSSCFSYKRKHVLATLLKLGKEFNYPELTNKIFSVGNKCDLSLDSPDPNLLCVSCKSETGLEELCLRLEDAVIRNTNRKVVTIKLLSGSDEIRWLRKNATLVSEVPNSEDNQYVNAKVIITNPNLQKFKHRFI